MVEIRSLMTLDDAEGVAEILTEYILFVAADARRAFGVRLDAQSAIDDTMAHLPDLVPPHGRTFLAEGDDGTILGLVMLRPASSGAVEIKRLYVRPAARGMKLGRKLVARAIAEAGDMGATRILLDSTPNLASAISLYRSFGFRDCPPYAESDLGSGSVLSPHMVFMSLDLD